MSTLSELIAAEWPKDLATMRQFGWRVVAHYDEPKTTVPFVTTWAFEREGRYVEASGGTDGEAIYHAMGRAELYDASVAHCPWCGNKLVQHATGLSCVACATYFEKGRWWRVSCNEAHSHDFRCLAEVRAHDPPAEPKL